MTKAEQFLIEIKIENEDHDHFFTEYGKINGSQIVSVFNDQSVFHAITKVDIFNKLNESLVFTFDDRYSAGIF